MEKQASIKSPIFILGLTKSGTTLLRNLLDGNKDLFVVPAETHFFQNIKKWVSYRFRESKPQNLNFEEMKLNLLRWMEFQNSVNDFITDGFTKNKWNIRIIKNELENTQITSLNNLFDVFYESLYKSLNNGVGLNKRIVEKSVENTEFVCELNSLYPNAKFIYILRNPYSNLVSLRKYLSREKKHWKVFFPRKGKKYFGSLRTPVFSMYNSYYYLYKYKEFLPNFKVIQYEELLKDSELQMKSIAEFLSIDYDSNLLNPTLLSQAWQGNSLSGNKFEGISQQNLDYWKKDISDIEIYIINKLFDFVLEDFEYKKLKVKKSIFFPSKSERLVNYLINRFLLFYMPRFDNKNSLD